MRLVELMRADK